MADIRIACGEDIPGLREIWSKIFGDSERFTELFFSRLLPSAAVFAAVQDGLLIGSAYILDIFTLKNGADELSCPYIYGVGVLPEFRGLGIGRQLTLACRDHCGEKYGQSCLVPAERRLFDYYERFTDYIPSFSVSEFELEPEVAALAEISRISGEEYGGLREKLLSPLPHLKFSAAALSFLEGLCALSEGGLYLLKSADACAVAACEDADGELYIKELLCSDGNSRGFAAALLWHLDYGSGSCRAPANEKHPESVKAFGMLSKSVKGGPFYFGPAFD